MKHVQEMMTDAVAAGGHSSGGGRKGGAAVVEIAAAAAAEEEAGNLIFFNELNPSFSWRVFNFKFHISKINLKIKLP